MRGYRIEIAEIEARLAQHLEVRECVVVAREDAPGEKRLVAYLVGDGERALISAELRDFMRETLPDYMVPSAFVALDALPLTPNGKVDRKALPAPERARLRAAADFVAPRTPVELELAEVWAQVLGVERVGVRDNFFALGGDSIRSVQVRARALERGLRFSIQQLFERQTVEALAQVLDSEHDDAPPSGYEPFSLVSGADRAKLPGGLEDAYPLARLQLGMLFHNEYSETGSTYQDVTSFHLKMALDLRKFEEAAARVFEHHPVLRISFDLGTYSEPLQLVHRAVSLPLTVEDLRGLTDDEQERRLDEWLNAEKTRRFDWSKPPLLRFHIHLRGEDDFQLTLIIHHAILDGWSVATMLTELFRLYFTLKGEAGSPEPAPTGRYAEFVALERAALESEESRAYWTRQSESFAPATLPRFAATAAVPAASRNRDVGVPLTHQISEGLKSVAASRAGTHQERAPRGTPSCARPAHRARGRFHRARLARQAGRGRRHARTRAVPEHAAVQLPTRRRELDGAGASGVRGRARAAAASLVPARGGAAHRRQRAPLRGRLQLHTLPYLREPARARAHPRRRDEGVRGDRHPTDSPLHR